MALNMAASEIRVPDIAAFCRTADPQLSSRFFTVLPPEIRSLICLEFWKLFSSRLHIIADEDEEEEGDEDEHTQASQSDGDGHDPGPIRLRLSHARCVTHPRAKDLLWFEL